MLSVTDVKTASKLLTYLDALRNARSFLVKNPDTEVTLDLGDGDLSTTFLVSDARIWVASTIERVEAQLKELGVAP